MTEKKVKLKDSDKPIAVGFYTIRNGDQVICAFSTDQMDFEYGAYFSREATDEEAMLRAMCMFFAQKHQQQLCLYFKSRTMFNTFKAFQKNPTEFLLTADAKYKFLWDAIYTLNSTTLFWILPALTDGREFYGASHHKCLSQAEAVCRKLMEVEIKKMGDVFKEKHNVRDNRQSVEANA